jgi:hypothetical protein
MTPARRNFRNKPRAEQLERRRGERWNSGEPRPRKGEIRERLPLPSHSITPAHEDPVDLDGDRPLTAADPGA